MNQQEISGEDIGILVVNQLEISGADIGILGVNQLEIFSIFIAPPKLQGEAIFKERAHVSAPEKESNVLPK